MSNSWNEKLAVLGDRIRPFCELLHAAADELAHLPQPVIVAACPNKFDDAGYTSWQAVRSGQAWWERSDYKIHGGSVFEEARDPDDAAAARKVLEGLEKKTWRDLAFNLLDFDHFHIIVALVLQDNARWFVLSEINEGVGGIFLLERENTLRHVGSASRLDETIRKRLPLTFEKIEHGMLPYLHSVLPDYPIGAPVPHDPESKARQAAFIDIVNPAFLALNELPGAFKYIYSSGDQVDHISRIVQSDVFEVTGTTRMSSKQEFFSRLQKAGKTAEQMSDVAEGLDKAEWHALFAKIFPEFFQVSRGSLSLYSGNSRNLIIANKLAVFEIDKADALRLVGVCDATPTKKQLWFSIHFFDGAII